MLSVWTRETTAHHSKETAELAGTYRCRRILATVCQGEYPAGPWKDRDSLNQQIVEQGARLAATGLAELHLVDVWPAYGEQDLRGGGSPYHPRNGS